MQQVFDINDFEAWTSPHLACVLLLDISDSMNDDGKIDILNKTLQNFKEMYENRFDVNKRSVVDIALVTFGGNGVELKQNFLPIGRFNPPILTASGETPLCEAIIYSLDLIEQRIQFYSAPEQVGCGYHRPWLFCITAGMLTDMENFLKAKEKIQSYVDEKKVVAICHMVNDFDTSKVVEMFGIGNCLHLEGIDFADYFNFLSNSISSIGVSSNGKEIPMSEEVKIHTRFFD
ncbi:MAG: hypothetical protein LBM93_03640 [Oscillospiraceae bacterium]|jgi:uncharacterized protein YegL|nr:hypothetical protein [Oscillospiraceae bacterium]